VSHIGPLGQIRGDHGLARGLGSKDHHGLRKDGLLGLGVDLADASGGVNLSHLSEFLVVLDNWISLIKVVLDPLLDGLYVVIGPTTSLSSLEASLEHDLLWHLVVKDLLCLNDILLKILGLIHGSGETINEIIL
jgi:hypothetical protein